MNTLTIVSVFAAIACASAGFLAGPSAVVAGPSGYVASSLSPAAYAAYAAPAAPAFAAYAAPAAPAFFVPPGSGLEGQYVPDNLESLYDDGSYKPYIYGP